MTLEDQLKALEARCAAARQGLDEALQEISEVAGEIITLFPKVMAEANPVEHASYLEITTTIRPVLTEFCEFGKRLAEKRGLGR